MTEQHKRRRSVLNRFLIYAGLALLAAATGWLTGKTSLGTQIELRTYDYRFWLKDVFPASTSAPITILALDDKSLERIPDPLMLWQRHFAEVLNHLSEADAAVVAFDILFFPIDKFDPDGETSLARALLSSGGKGMPVILAVRVRDNGIDKPPERLEHAANAFGEGFAFVNLSKDLDDFVRRQALQDEAAMHPSFALAAAQAFAKRRNRPLEDRDVRGRALIDYMARGTFPRVSFADALEAAKNNDQAFFRNNFAGRIVLIGRVSDPGGEDLHSTPLYYLAGAESPEGSRTPGIDIHANTIAMLVDNRSIVELSDRLQLLSVVLAAIAFTYIWGGVRRFALVFSVLVAAAYTIFVMATFVNGTWVPTVAPAASAASALVLTLGANYFLEGKEKRRIRNLFTGYVSDAVIAQLLESDGVTLTGERRRVAILFADIKGFTTISETASPERVVEMLNEYFGTVVEIIQARGGTVNSLMGDGIMAIFGAPILDTDAALHATEAAREMMKAMARVNDSLAANGFDPIGIGVGINSGEAVVGNMGSPRKMEYTAIGDVVNTAARIEGQTRNFAGADILISEDAYQWIAGRMPAEFVAEPKLKGKDVAVRLYKVAWK